MITPIFFIHVLLTAGPNSCLSTGLITYLDSSPLMASSRLLHAGSDPIRRSTKVQRESSGAAAGMSRVFCPETTLPEIAEIVMRETGILEEGLKTGGKKRSK